MHCIYLRNILTFSVVITTIVLCFLDLAVNQGSAKYVVVIINVYNGYDYVASVYVMVICWILIKLFYLI
jgi:hypothetical protein